MTTAAARTRRCSRCGSERAAHEEFCQHRMEDGSICLGFLDWLSDRVDGPDAPPMTAARPAPRAGADELVPVLVDVAVDGEPPRGPDEPLVASAAPGGHATLTVHLRNVGTLVQTFAIGVRGHGDGWHLPRAWVRISGADRALELNPFDHPEPSEGSSAIVLQVPVHDAPAGPYGFAITVRSLDGSVDIDAATGTLHVLPRFNAVATASPLIAVGRRSATFRVLVINNGNADIVPVLRLSDAQGRCTFSAPAARERGAIESIPPEDELVYERIAHARRRLVGRPFDHQIKIEVTVGRQPLPPLGVVFRQRALIPWWLLPLLLALALAALLLYLLWPRAPRKVTMPGLRGLRSEFQARERMIQAGLTATPRVYMRVSPRVHEGTVLGQKPRSGTRVDPDQPVILRVAVPPAFTLIPDLIGYTWDRAEARLTHSHLKLGDVLPSKLSTRRVIRQSPRPGRARARGTAVDLVLAGPPLRTVPNVRCLTPKRAQHRLEAHGFRLRPVPEFTGPGALARSQMPAAGTRQRTGREIRLFFKGGNPCRPLPKPATGGDPGLGIASAQRPGAPIDVRGAIAFDDGRAVRLARRPGILASGRQAAWSPGGTLLAAASRSRIVVARPGGSPAPIATLRADGAEPSMPAFAPVTATGRAVIAFLAAPPHRASRICFAAVGRAAPATSCAGLAGIRARALAWSPDGTTIAVAGARATAPRRPGIIRLSTTSPGAADAAAWVVDPRLERPRRGDAEGAVFDVAFEPRGSRLALVTDIGPTGRRVAPQIVLAPRDSFAGSLRGARWLRTPACQLAWSPDADRMAAIQRTGGCASPGAVGRLVAFAVAAPAVAARVSARASRPVWRPTGRAGGQP